MCLPAPCVVVCNQRGSLSGCLCLCLCLCLRLCLCLVRASALSHIHTRARARAHTHTHTASVCDQDGFSCTSTYEPLRAWTVAINAEEMEEEAPWYVERFKEMCSHNYQPYSEICTHLHSP